MANDIYDAFATWMRDYVDNGIPSSGENEPKKLEGRALGVLLQSKHDTLEASTSGLIDDVAEQDGRLTALEGTVVASFHRAASVVTSTTANVDLSGGGLANGTVHDGVVVSTGQRVAVVDQTTGSQKGLYIVPASGAASRASDADSASELQGMAVYIEGGATRGGWTMLQTVSPVTVGTTALNFTKIEDTSILDALIDTKSADIRIATATENRSSAGGGLEHARARDIGSFFAAFDSNGSTRKQWFAAFKMGTDDRLDAVRMVINDEAHGSVTIEADLYLQPSFLSSSAQIVDISQYILLDSFVGSAADYFTPGGGVQTITLPVASKPYLSAGARLVYAVRLKNSGGSLIGFGCGYTRHYALDEEEFAKGGFATSAALTSISSVSAGAKIHAEPLSRRPAEKPAEQGSSRARTGVRLVPVEGRRKDNNWGLAFTRIAVVARPSRGIAAPAALGLYISLATTVVYFRLRAWTRPVADGNYAASPFQLGSGVNDVAIFSRDYKASDLINLSTNFSSEEQYAEFDLLGMPSIGVDQLLMIEVTGYQNDRITAAPFSVSKGQGNVDGSFGLLYGAYSTASPPGEVQVPSGPHHFELLEAVRMENAGRAGATPIVDRVTFLDVVQTAQTTPSTLLLPALGVTGAARRHVVPAQTVALDAVAGPGPTSKTDAINLRYLEWDALSARFWSGNPVVTRVSDSVVLTAGTHYEVEEGTGRIRGLVNTATFAVSVEMQAYKCRIDLITLDAWDVTGTSLAVWNGTAQYADPDNWRPTLSSIGSNGRIAVAEVLVKADGLEVIDLTAFHHRSKIAIGRESEIEALKRWNHEQLALVRLALMRGQNLTWIGYGDSVTGCGGGSETAWQTVPGGPSRDTRSYLTIQTADASLAQMGTPATDGPAGAGLHWYGSFNARTAKTLQDRFGGTVTYKNLGIGGTTTGSEGSGTPEDRYGGSNANRLAGVLAAKGSTGLTVVCIGFGTNEDDNENLINNLTVIGRYCLTNGMVPILVGQPAIAYNSSRTIVRQKKNDERIMRAARTIPCAYVPLSLITHEQRGASGIFQTLQSGAGGTNHPGIWEHAKYSEWIDELCFRV